MSEGGMSLSTLLVPTVASYHTLPTWIWFLETEFCGIIPLTSFCTGSYKSEHCKILSHTNKIVLLTCIVKISSSSLVRIRFSLFLSTVNALTSNPDDMTECAEDSNKNKKKNIFRTLPKIRYIKKFKRHSIQVQ